MEQISKILRILLKRMPYQPFINGELNCLSMNKNKLAEAVRCYMPLYSDTEIRYMMERLGNLLQEYNAFLNSTYRDVSDDISIFDTVFHFADDILIRTNNEIMVRYEHILRWRTTTTDIAEDIFVTAFQARHDLRDYIYCKDFTWPTVIGHNNMQLRKITDKGIGNGVSIIIMIGIIARLPFAFFDELTSRVSQQGGGLVAFLIEIILLFFVFCGTILLVQGTRKVPVQYAKRIVGNKQYGGVRQYIPLKINAAGVMPIIFAQAIMLLPISFVNYAASESLSGFATAFSNSSLVLMSVFSAKSIGMISISSSPRTFGIAKPLIL